MSTQNTPMAAAIKIRTLLVEWGGLRSEGGKFDPLEQHNFPHSDVAAIVEQTVAAELARVREVNAELAAQLQNAVRCGERDGMPGNPGSAPGWVTNARAALAKHKAITN